MAEENTHSYYPPRPSDENEGPENLEVMSEEKSGAFLREYQRQTHVWDYEEVREAIAQGRAVSSTEWRVTHSEARSISVLTAGGHAQPGDGHSWLVMIAALVAFL